MQEEVHHHFHHHLHHHADEATAERLRRIDHTLSALKEIIMSTLDDLKATLDTIDTKVSAVKTDVDTLLAKLAAIPTSGLTPEQQQAIDDAVVHAQNIATSLGAIDTTVNPPTA